jgi:hypothetical protein
MANLVNPRDMSDGFMKQVVSGKVIGRRMEEVDVT